MSEVINTNDISEEELNLIMEAVKTKNIIDNNSVEDNLFSADIFSRFSDAEVKRLNEMIKEDSLHNKLCGIIVNGAFIEITKWWELLEFIIREAFIQEGKRRMAGYVFQWKWVSDNKCDLRRPHLIENTGYYIDSAISSDVAVQRAKEVYELIEDICSISLVINYNDAAEEIDEKDILNYNEYDF